MRILAIETSCDETAIAIAEFTGPKSRPVIDILSNIISSQVKLHAKFGGVVPNLAKREHQRNLVPVLLKAFAEADHKDLGFMIYDLRKIGKQKIPKSKILNMKSILEREPELLKQLIKKVFPLRPPKIDAIAVTIGPGLAPALWVGVNFAKALSYLWNKPLIPTNHMAGHIYSALIPQDLGFNIYDLGTQPKQKNLKSKILNLKSIKFPALALLVSGGHTELVLVRGYGKYKIIGETLDDAAGEAFDKVARLLGLGYPGGPEIAKLAEKGNPNRYKLPSPMINSQDYNFSFSGLKTAVFYLIRDVVSLASHKLEAKLTTTTKANIAASFQKATVDVLVTKTIRAAKEYKIKTILLGGGVAANKILRERLAEEIKENLPATTYQLPAFFVTGDNALMIALAAYFSGIKKPWIKIRADANIRLNETTLFHYGQNRSTDKH